MRIDVDTNLADVSDKLGVLYGALNSDLKPLMQGIGAIVENSSRDRFRTKTAPNGSSWADLKPSTIAAKSGGGAVRDSAGRFLPKAASARGGILVDKGDLMRSITYHANAVSVTVGSDRPSAKYHQDGTKYMEARPIFGLSDDDVLDIRDLVNDFMEDLL